MTKYYILTISELGKIKAEIDSLKDIFKIVIAVLVAVIASL